VQNVAETGLALMSLLEEFLAQKAEISRLQYHVSVLSCRLHCVEKREKVYGRESAGGRQDLVNPAEAARQNEKGAHWVEEKGGKKRGVEEEEAAEPVVRGKADRSESRVASRPVAEGVGAEVGALKVASLTRGKEPEGCSDPEPVEVLDYRSLERGEIVGEVDNCSWLLDKDMVVEEGVVPVSWSFPGLLTNIVQSVLLGPRGWSSSPVPSVGYRGRGQGGVIRGGGLAFGRGWVFRPC